MNQEEIWRTLGITPTVDEKSIRKAYATLSRKIHPEEQEEAFLKLKKAYELAMAWAKREKIKNKPELLQNLERTLAVSKKNKKASSGSKLFELFPQEQDFSEHPAFEEFYHLYFVVGEYNENRWKRYFLSADFLDVFLEEGFLVKICETLTKTSNYNIVFYRYLLLVYQIYPLPHSIETVAVDCKGVNRLIELYHLLKHTLSFPKGLSGEDMTFFLGFLDYYQILYLEKERGMLEDGNYDKALLHLYEHYHYGELVSKTEGFSWSKSNLFQQPRHFDSLELIASALRKIHYDSHRIELIMDAMGFHDVLDSRDFLPTEKIRGYFAPIFLVLGRYYPDYLQKTPTYWQTLNEKLLLLAQQLEQEKNHEPQQLSLVNQFFQQKDTLLEALYDPDYMGTFFLHNLLSQSNSAIFLSGFLRLVQEHPQIEEGFLDMILERLWQVQEIKQRKEEISHLCTMENHEYLRYYLSANFPHIQNWLVNEYPVHSSWLEKVMPEERREGEEVEFFGEVFMLYKSRQFWAYYQNSLPVSSKCFHYHQLQALNEEDFWLCLPLACCSYGDEEEVVEDLVLRFSQLQKEFPWKKLAEKIFLQMAEDYSQWKEFLEVKTFSRYAFGDKIGKDYFQYIVREVTGGQEHHRSHVVLEKIEQGLRTCVGRFSSQLSPKDAVYCLNQHIESMKHYPLEQLQDPVHCHIFQPDMRRMSLEYWLMGIWEEGSFMAEIAWERSKLQFMTYEENIVCLLSAGEEQAILHKDGQWKPFQWDSKGMNPMKDLHENFLYFPPMVTSFPREVMFYNKLTVLQHLYEILFMVAQADKDLRGGGV